MQGTGSGEDFQEMEQQFLRNLRDFQDEETTYQRTLLDATIDLDSAISLLLKTQCASFDLTREIDDLRVSVNETIRSIVRPN